MSDKLVWVAWPNGKGGFLGLSQKEVDGRDAEYIKKHPEALRREASDKPKRSK